MELPGGCGAAEVRAVPGGFFIAPGAAPLIFGSPDMYMMLAAAYWGVGAERAVSMFIDDALISSNFIGFAVGLSSVLFCFFELNKFIIYIS